MMSFADEGEAILVDLQRLRRELHRIPELDLELPATRARVLEELEGLPLRLTLGERCSSIVAVLDGALPGPTVLLRADMDGLPVPEETGLPYASTNGSMHACGHDLHMAGLVGAARLLCAHRAELAGTVVFMFQPGEEAAGGAKVMLEEDLLKASGSTPIAAYGIHVWSNLPTGVFTTRRGTVMASANRINIAVTGRGGHSSAPATTIDPVPALCELVLALQTTVTRKVDVFDPVVLSVTQLTGSAAINAIPTTATLGASVRTLAPDTTDLVEHLIGQAAREVSAAHQCSAEVAFQRHYPATRNDPATTATALGWLADEFGADRVTELDNPVMGSEDFSYVLEEVPGTFILLGALGEGLDPATAATNHASTVIFDDAVLGAEAAALASLAWRRLEEARAA